MGRFTLGNLGHSDTDCDHTYLALNVQTNIMCDTGRLSKIKAFGIMPEKGDF